MCSIVSSNSPLVCDRVDSVIGPSSRPIARGASWGRQPFPALADAGQAALDGGDGDVEPPGDLRVGVSFHLVARDLPQLILGKRRQQLLALLGQLRGELRVGFVALDE